MDLLKAAIANSKAKLNEKRKLDSTNNNNKEDEEEQPVKKFKTRGEIEAERQAAAQREKDDRARVRESAAAPSYIPRDYAKEEAEIIAADKAEKAAKAEAEATMISANEVKRRLRGYSEPITLFGETDLMRLNRLKLFELHQHEKMTSSMGRKNLFAEILQQDVESEIKAALMKEEEQRKAEEAAVSEAAGTSTTASSDSAAAASSSSTAAASSSAAAAASPSASPTDFDADDEAAALDETGKVLKSSKGLNSKDYRGQAFSREDFETPEEFILYFFKRMLSEWEAELDARPKEVRMSERGKMASAVQKQTRAFIKPLFKLLKTNTTSPDILKACENMATACLHRDYIKAQEAYLTMAIGNAAWPMGVTMVSIHERAGRTKLFSGQVAHVLNDETQRKYIQSVKRLMSFCEEHYPGAYTPNK